MAEIFDKSGNRLFLVSEEVLKKHGVDADKIIDVALDMAKQADFLRKCGLKVDPSMLEYYARNIRKAIKGDA